MAPKPGLTRAIPMALIGFVVGALLVIAVRALQSVEPVVDAGVILVVTPFFITGFFLWGMGGFDPKMSEHHAHEPEGGLVTALVKADEIHEEHHEEPAPPVTILGYEIWKVFTLTLLIIVGVFAFAMIPDGFFLKTVNEAEASRVDFAQGVRFDLPLGLGYFEGSQLAVFLGFVLFTMFSLFIFGGAIGGLMYFLSRSVEQAKQTVPSEKALTPPAPARVVGRAAGSLARSLRRGIPNFFGQK
jgi:hypothetical protein